MVSGCKTAGNNLGDLKKTAADLINDYRKKGIQYNEILDFGFERRKDTIICQVINREKNKKLLETLPHDKILDLAVTYHCLIQEGYFIILDTFFPIIIYQICCCLF